MYDLGVILSCSIRGRRTWQLLQDTSIGQNILTPGKQIKGLAEIFAQILPE